VAERQLDNNLGTKERVALLALLALARPVTNAELRQAAGIELTGEPRRNLANLKLVTSELVNRRYVHELTDAGWRWCAEEFTAEPPARATSYVRALYGVLRHVRAHLDHAGVPLAEVFGAKAEPADVPSRIRAVYAELAGGPEDWVSLTDVRARLADLPRETVDAALIELQHTSSAYIMPNENRKTLTAADRAAAIRIGDKDRHMLAIAD
jgi:hypothetical protein